MRSILTLFLILLPISVQAELSVKAPATAVIGELVRLEASSEGVVWGLITEEGQKDFEADGKKAYFSARKGGDYQFIAVGIENGKPVFKIHKLQVAGKPDDPVVPPVKPDLSDASKVVIELAGPIKDPSGKAEGAQIIAAAYRKHGQLALKGEYKDPNVMADATSSEFVYELGLNRYVKWRPMMTRLREHMAKLMAEGKLKDMQSWAALWEEYAKGFDAVASAGGAGTNGATR